MTAIDTTQTLTGSGMGLRITDRPITSMDVEEVRDLVRRYQWLAFQKQPVEEAEVVDYLARFGDLTQNDRRRGAVLQLDGSQKDEVLLGQGFMPLHRDGALMGTSIALVGIYCARYRGVSGGGRTFITDIQNGIKAVPQHILDVLQERGIEGRPVDRYYTSSSDTWHPIAGFSEVEGERFLNVGFPYRPGEPASWDMRIPGLSEAEFWDVFTPLTETLMSEQYCYYHAWQEGDLLLLDNQRTLHGREAFDGGDRALSNIQVVAA